MQGLDLITTLAQLGDAVERNPLAKLTMALCQKIFPTFDQAHAERYNAFY